MPDDMTLARRFVLRSFGADLLLTRAADGMAGAAASAALAVAEELGVGKRVVVVLPDTGERYSSMESYFEPDKGGGARA